MSDQFVAEIRIFGFNFPPAGWALCAGQLMPISQNTALFSLLGTMYGGDGKSTFGLPNMQGNAPMFWGQGAGLSLRDEGELSGSQNVTLLTTEMPAHIHTAQANAAPGTLNAPDQGRALARSSGGTIYSAANPDVAMSFSELAPAGSSLPHNNMQPYLTLNFCIALQGIFPARQGPPPPSGKPVRKGLRQTPGATEAAPQDKDQ